MSQYQKKHSPTHTHEEEEGFADNKVQCLGTHPLHGALSQRVLLDRIKPAYNPSRPDGRLRLTATTFNRLWISSQYTSTYCYAELAASFINFLHYCSPSSGFYGAGKDNRGRQTDATPSRLLVRPLPSSPHFHTKCLFVPQPLQFILAWDRHRINAGLYTPVD